MKTIILTFMLFLMLPMSSTMKLGQLTTIPLSMMKHSVDDMYSGCTEKMDEKVKSDYFPTEMKNNTLFEEAWNKSKSCAQTKFRNRTDNLTIDHLQAICVYTGHYCKVYDQFNAAVRDSAENYSTPSFQYHALHFWLTSALQILNPNQHCNITYRRTNISFTGNRSQEIRFGFFASSSYKTDLTRFGHVTCFRIKTCFGGYLKDYPEVGKYEEEVLIPPYEKFNITNSGKGSKLNIPGLEDCETIFFLESLGHLSNLNCKAI